MGFYGEAVPFLLCFSRRDFCYTCSNFMKTCSQCEDRWRGSEPIRVFSYMQNRGEVQRGWPWARLQKKRLSRVSWVLGRIWSPVNMRNVVVLLSCNKRSHHSVQNTVQTKNNLEEMSPAGVCAFHSFGTPLAFRHLLKRRRQRLGNTVHHKTTQLFIRADY